MLAGRRPGRRWGPPTTFADGWVRKKKRCQQFSYRSTSSAGIGIFVSIVFSHSGDRSHSFKPVVHTVLYPAFLLITCQPFPVIYSFRTHHFGHLMFH